MERGRIIMANGMQSSGEELEDDVMVCHVHDSSNNHIGTGEGLNRGMALENAIADAEQKGQLSEQGSFGCANEKTEGPEVAHQRAIDIQAKPENMGGMPGTDIDIR